MAEGTDPARPTPTPRPPPAPAPRPHVDCAKLRENLKPLLEGDAQFKAFAHAVLIMSGCETPASLATHK